MIFATRYESAQGVVETLEKGLGISMRRHDDAERGTYFSWNSEVGMRNGISFYSISVRPTHAWDVEEAKHFLVHRDWAGYSIVISISEELTGEVVRIREMIASGQLAADELPSPVRHRED